MRRDDESSNGTGGQKHEPADRLVAVDAVAEMLSISDRTIWRMSSGGELPKPVHVRGRARWRLSDIMKYMDGLR